MLSTNKIEMLNHLFSFIYPSLCYSCERELRGDEKQICLHCEEDIPSFEAHSEMNGFKDNPVHQLFWGKSDVSYATSCYEYIKGEKLQNLVHQLKYKGQRDLADYFAKIMAQEIESNHRLKSVDGICYVPSSKRKTKQRGYNQAQELAKSISKLNAIPVANLLVKQKNTSSQTSKNVNERHVNLENSFALNKKEKQPSAFKHILLIDDVITTGATLNACAKIILKEYRAEVSVLTLAYRHI